MSSSSSSIQPSSVFTWETLPDEISIKVFSKLDPRSISPVARVCKKWQSFIEYEQVLSSIVKSSMKSELLKITLPNKKDRLNILHNILSKISRYQQLEEQGIYEVGDEQQAMLAFYKIYEKINLTKKTQITYSPLDNPEARLEIVITPKATRDHSFIKLQIKPVGSSWLQTTPLHNVTSSQCYNSEFDVTVKIKGWNLNQHFPKMSFTAGRILEFLKKPIEENNPEYIFDSRSRPPLRMYNLGHVPFDPIKPNSIITNDGTNLGSQIPPSLQISLLSPQPDEA